MSKDYDFVVIGGGSAGYAAAATASKAGLTVAVIEGGDEVGGLCILKGCMPSKALLESAKRFDTLRRATEFGLRAENISAHGDEIIARKKRLVQGFADYRRQQLESGDFDFIRGMAGFVDAHTVEIVSAENERTQITAPRVSRLRRDRRSSRSSPFPGWPKQVISTVTRCWMQRKFRTRWSCSAAARGRWNSPNITRRWGRKSRLCSGANRCSRKDGRRCRRRAGDGV